MSLSDRIRPDVEAAPWVVEEVKKLEAEVERLRAELRTVAERQREADKTACFRAKFSITGSPDLRAVIFNAGCDSAAQKVGCTPLVTEGDK